MAETADVALEYFRALSSGDVEGAVNLVADGADFRSPMGSMDGKAAIRLFLGGFDTAFPGARFDVDQVIEGEHVVAVEGVYRGTHGGPLMTPGGALAATGRDVSAPFVTIIEVANGKISAHRPYWDVAGFMAQLTG